MCSQRVCFARSSYNRLEINTGAMLELCLAMLRMLQQMIQLLIQAIMEQMIRERVLLMLQGGARSATQYSLSQSLIFRLPLVARRMIMVFSSIVISCHKDIKDNAGATDDRTHHTRHKPPRNPHLHHRTPSHIHPLPPFIDMCRSERAIKQSQY